MIDNDIIKALECCCIKHACSQCNYSKDNSARCISSIMKDALDLINRQKTEIERLKIENIQMGCLDNLVKEMAGDNE